MTLKKATIASRDGNTSVCSGCNKVKQKPMNSKSIIINFTKIDNYLHILNATLKHKTSHLFSMERC